MDAALALPPRASNPPLPSSAETANKLGKLATAAVLLLGTILLLGPRITKVHLDSPVSHLDNAIERLRGVQEKPPSRRTARVGVDCRAKPLRLGGNRLGRPSV